MRINRHLSYLEKKAPQNHKWRGWLLLILPGLLIWTLAACNGGTEPAPVSQSPKAATEVMEAPADGTTLLNERCSTCHGANRVKQADKNAAQWDQTVNRMIAKGARLTEAEKTILLDYLGKNYAP